MSKFRSALSLISAKYKEPSVCESCGGEFICGATLTGCWCMSVKLTDETRAELRKRFKDCLCRDCLENFRPGASEMPEGR